MAKRFGKFSTGAIVGMVTEIEDPGLVNRYAENIRLQAIPPNKRGTNTRATAQHEKDLEADIATFLNARNVGAMGGKERKLVPDYRLDSKELIDALGKYMAMGAMGRSEQKMKRATDKETQEYYESIGKPVPQVKKKPVEFGATAVTGSFLEEVRQSALGQTTLGDEGGEDVFLKKDVEGKYITDKNGNPIFDKGKIKDFLAIVGPELNQAYGKGWYDAMRVGDPRLFAKFYAKAKVLQITSLRAGKLQVMTFSFPMDTFKPNPFDFHYRTTKGHLKVSLVQAAETRLRRAVTESGLKVVADTPQRYAQLVRNIQSKRVVNKTQDNLLPADVDVLYSSGSIGVSNFIVSPFKNKKTSREKTKHTRGKFLSNIQLSAILQQRLTKVMPRYPEPQRPTPRYITGKLAQSFRILANYRTATMGFYNTPPAAEYVDELNQNGWMLDKTLVEPTIRQITQQLFGRQFRVLRTQ